MTLLQMKNEHVTWASFNSLLSGGTSKMLQVFIGESKIRHVCRQSQVGEGTCN